MHIFILTFVAGVAMLQQQAVLPQLVWAWALLPGAACALLLCRSHAPVVKAAGKVLSVTIFLGAGFFWAAALAHWRLSDTLPREWEGRDIQLIGAIAELPQVNERSLRFAFDVEQVLTQGAIVPARVSLAWYADRGKHEGALLPLIRAGERWRVTVRLKRPHGSINPHGFDFEQ